MNEEAIKLAMYELAESVFKIRVFATDVSRDSARNYIEYIRENWDESFSEQVIEIIKTAFSI